MPAGKQLKLQTDLFLGLCFLFYIYIYIYIYIYYLPPQKLNSVNRLATLTVWNLLQPIQQNRKSKDKQNSKICKDNKIKLIDNRCWLLFIKNERKGNLILNGKPH